MSGDISQLPARTRWRYRLRPAWLRYAINRAWPGRWTQLEIDQIQRRAHQRWLEMQDYVD